MVVIIPKNNSAGDARFQVLGRNKVIRIIKGSKKAKKLPVAFKPENFREAVIIGVGIIKLGADNSVVEGNTQITVL
jgi:hypothetical protein